MTTSHTNRPSVFRTHNYPLSCAAVAEPPPTPLPLYAAPHHRQQPRRQFPVLPPLRTSQLPRTTLSLCPRQPSRLRPHPQPPASMSHPPLPRPSASPMPSFQSVFGQDNATSDMSRTSTATTTSSAATSTQSLDPASLAQAHQHRDSTSTVTSESTDSSPTTTISTVDSTSISESSPGSSPQSPNVKLPTLPLLPPQPPSTLTAMQPFASSLRPRTSDEKTQPTSPFMDLQRATTPPKKARNLKNLAVNTSGQLPLGRAVATAALPLQASDRCKASTNAQQAEPGFVKPQLPRRRSSNLGLSIPTQSGPPRPSPQEVRVAVPPTPSFKKPNMLRHFQSSPSLPLFSPSISGPEGGMQLPPRAAAAAPVPTTMSKTWPAATAEVNEEEDDDEPNFDIPQSREEKPEAYPHGPICIYDTGLDLYLEPTAEIAGRYDVVFNVASEVHNPFVNDIALDRFTNLQNPPATAIKAPTTLHIPNDSGVVLSPAADRAPSSPSTPKATPVPSSTDDEKQQQLLPATSDLPFRAAAEAAAVEPAPKSPEYVHIPWEHNTDIVPDLFKLVRMIDDRIRLGKRVLVHCQCGVSRSASLVVAYGLYVNTQLSVQEAYDAVKRRSKWIGPNMNLIMQLQEFRSGLLKAERDPAYYAKVYGADAPLLSARRSHLGPSTALQNSSTTPVHSTALDGVRYPTPSLLSTAAKETAGGSAVSSPLKTAPLPPDDEQATESRNTLMLSDVAKMEVLSPGPSSAPSGMPWPVDHRRSWGPEDTPSMVEPKEALVTGEGDFVSAAGKIVPASTVTGVDTSRRATTATLDALVSPTQQTFHLPTIRSLRATAQQPPSLLFSPRSETFGSLDSLLPSRPSRAPPAPLTLSSLPAPKAQTSESDVSLASPRSEEFSMHDVHEPQPEDDFGMFSPRVADPHQGTHPGVPVLAPVALEPMETPKASKVVAPTPSPPPAPLSTSPASRPLPFRQAAQQQQFHQQQQEKHQQRPVSPLSQEPIAEDPLAEAMATEPRPLNLPQTTTISPTASISPISPPAPISPDMQQQQAANTSRRLLRPKFSAPNLQTQIRLRELQSDIAARLPSHQIAQPMPTIKSPLPLMPGGFPETPADALAPGKPWVSLNTTANGNSDNNTDAGVSLNRPTMVIDPEETLLSPRAVEFTRNPFHWELRDLKQQGIPRPRRGSFGDAPPSSSLRNSMILSNATPTAPVAAKPSNSRDGSEERRDSESDNAPGGVSLDSLFSPGLGAPAGFGSLGAPPRAPAQASNDTGNGVSLAPQQQQPSMTQALHAKGLLSTLRTTDPRSPAVKGVSPITRNIWDVL